MTSAPANLLAVRRLLLDELGVHGLASAEVGIVGDAAHIGEGDSYHLGVPEQDVNGRYSVGESPRDSSGLNGYASALDVGTFSVRTATGTHSLISFSRWVVAQCAAGAADTRDIREVIYSPDGQTVRRWDRLGKRTTGDSSHLYHTHFSFFRDSTRAGRDQTPLFRRYLTTIGLLAPTTGVDDMFCKRGDTGPVVQALQYGLQALGFDPGSVDGAYGPGTAAAVVKMGQFVGSGMTNGDDFNFVRYVQMQMAYGKRFAP
ncbi:MAG TPA: peptidoglycan-binding domain-containing protein, partial [Pseudonocardia sp.]